MGTEFMSLAKTIKRLFISSTHPTVLSYQTIFMILILTTKEKYLSVRTKDLFPIKEKQQQLTSKILSATLAQQTSTPYELTWNATGEECTPWTLEDLAALAFAIDARVTALVSYQQAKEVAMREAVTLEELEGVNVDYDAVS